MFWMPKLSRLNGMQEKGFLLPFYTYNVQGRNKLQDKYRIQVTII